MFSWFSFYPSCLGKFSKERRWFGPIEYSSSVWLDTQDLSGLWCLLGRCRPYSAWPFHHRRQTNLASDHHERLGSETLAWTWQIPSFQTRLFPACRPISCRNSASRASIPVHRWTRWSLPCRMETWLWYGITIYNIIVSFIVINCSFFLLPFCVCVCVFYRYPTDGAITWRVCTSQCGQRTNDR